jgi:hypothetical protein
VLELLPPQLGLSRAYLQSVDYTALLRADLEVVLRDLQRCSDGTYGSAGGACDLARLEKVSSYSGNVCRAVTKPLIAFYLLMFAATSADERRDAVKR